MYGTHRCINKFYVVEEKVTILDLGREKQKSGEDLNAFVKRFIEKTNDCVDSISESTKIKMCMAGMLDDYRMFLKNLDIHSFSKLIDEYKRMAASLKSKMKMETQIPMGIPLMTGPRPGEAVEEEAGDSTVEKEKG